MSMCRVLRVHRSGYYAWKLKPLSNRAIVDAALLVEIKRSYEDSYGIYGSPRILQPDLAWVTDNTYIRTYQGWLYLAVVIDLYTRSVVGWSMKRQWQQKSY